MEIIGTIDELQVDCLRIKQTRLNMPRDLGKNILSHFCVGDKVLVEYYHETKQVKAVVKQLPITHLSTR